LGYKFYVVVSNNNGFSIARSNEAKALGITMGAAILSNKSFQKLQTF